MTAREQSRAGPKGLALRTLDGSLAVAIISLLGEGVNHQPDPEGTFLLPPVGDIFIALQHGFRTTATFGTPFAAAPVFGGCPIMAFRRRQRALEQHLSRADPRQPAYAGCSGPSALPSRHRQRPDPVQHVTEQPPVQMPLGQRQPVRTARA